MLKYCSNYQKLCDVSAFQLLRVGIKYQFSIFHLQKIEDDNTETSEFAKQKNRRLLSRKLAGEIRVEGRTSTVAAPFSFEDST